MFSFDPILLRAHVVVLQAASSNFSVCANARLLSVLVCRGGIP